MVCTDTVGVQVEGRFLFDWDDNNLDRVADHDLDPDEVEAALLDTGWIGMPAYNVGTKRRWAAVGATMEGRILFIVFTRRHGLIHVVPARDATAREQRRYRSRGT
jgi:uncharacterized protein